VPRENYDESLESLGEDLTKVTVVRRAEGYEVEVEGEVRGTVFPDLHSALIWVQILAEGPYTGNLIACGFEDRRGRES
jgi:hypothetical protein